MSDEHLFEEALLKVIEDKKDKALALVEMALAEWSESRIREAHESGELSVYFVGWLRRARSEFYNKNYGKNRQEGSGGENG